MVKLFKFWLKSKTNGRLSLILNVATGVFSNVICKFLGRILKDDEKKRFKKIVKEVLEKYEVEIDENVAKELFECLIFGNRERVYNIAEERGFVDFVNEIERRLLLDEKLRSLIAEVRNTKILDEIRDALVGERVEDLLNDYKAFLVEKFRYLDLKVFLQGFQRREL